MNKLFYDLYEYDRGYYNCKAEGQQMGTCLCPNTATLLPEGGNSKGGEQGAGQSKG